jgi:hypothetical protein
VPAAQLTALGSRYLAQTAPLCRGHERFTDKLPNNFSHIGLIHAILPQATVIDARRHPMDACFSTFKQHFAIGQTLSRGPLGLGAAQQSAALPVRRTDAQPGAEHPPAARALRAAFRARLPRLSRDPPLGAHRECLERFE